MRKMFVMLLCVTLGAGFCGCGRKESGEVAARRSIAVIPKGTTHSFWKTIHAGALKASKETGVDVIWQGPLKEDDRQQQIQVVQNFISRGVDAIVLAPLDDRALVPGVNAAVKRGIPVIVIDSGLNADTYSSFVATDNYKGGVLCAKRLAEVMGGKGKVIMLRYAEGSASTMKREQGFLDSVKEYGPGFELLSTSQHSGATIEKAFQAAQNLLNRFGDVEGVFCPNESSAQGMLRALQTSGRAGKVKFVGFDCNDTLIKGLENGEIHGLAQQNPFKMGYLGVKKAVDVLDGKSVEKRIDTGVVMLTLDNLNTPELQALIKPDFARWLGE